MIKVLMDNFTGGKEKIVLKLESDIREGSLSSTVIQNKVNIQQASLRGSVKRLKKVQKMLENNKSCPQER